MPQPAAAEPDGHAALQHVEQVGVAAVDVQVGALAARREPRPGGVHRVVLGEDLDPPVGGVGDQLARAARHHVRLAHAPSVAQPASGRR